MGTKLLHPMLRRVVDAGVMSEAQALALGAAPAGELAEVHFAALRRALTVPSDPDAGSEH
jgi:hypothetical protein